MGKDKKEKNPADAFRKDQRKKELLKLKKDREMVKGVRDMLNDPRKIDEEIAKAQKNYDENKLDKSLKDKIKELQRMKDVANTRQLVLAAQGKKSLEEAESIIKPSIYQKNEGVWDNPMGNKSSSSRHGHVKSASRISTEGLTPHISIGDSNVAALMPLPTSTMTPYPAYAPSAFPIAPQPGRGPVMGGVAGIPLPPPRPVAHIGTYNPALHQSTPHGLPLRYAVPPPPPPLPQRPGMQMPGGFIPPPPGPPPGYTPQMYGHAPAGVPGAGIMQGAPMYAYPGQQTLHPPQGYGVPQYHQHLQHQHQQPGGPPKQQQPKDRKPRPPRGGSEEIDPLDPAGRGYTERFGAAAPSRKPPVQANAQEEVAVATAQPSPSCASAVDVVEASGQTMAAPQENISASPSLPSMAPSYTAVSAGELMRRRHMVPSEEKTTVEGAQCEPAGPCAGSISIISGDGSSVSYATLSAEELLRRRHQLPVGPNEMVAPGAAEEDFTPARPPVSYGAVLSAEELMRRRYMIQEAADSQDRNDENADSYPGPAVRPSIGPGPVLGPFVGPTHAAEELESSEELIRQRFEIPSYKAEDVESEEDEGLAPGPAREQQEGVSQVDSEELMRQRYEIPEDVHSDDDRKNEYFSEDDVRSAGEPEPTFDDDGNAVEEDLDDADDQPLELNLRNLYPARLPASFTALPQPRINYSTPMPSAAAKPSTSAYSSAINFNDYGDDEDEEDPEDEVLEEPTSMILPYASAAPQAPAVLPARAPDNFPTSSYYPEGLESTDITHAVVKGPKIVKTDRALTAFVPNAIKKKRLHSGVTTSTTFSTFRKPVAHVEETGVENEGGDEHDETTSGEPVSKAARQDNAVTDYTASLHAATSALFRPSVAPAPSASSSIAAVPAGRTPIAPIAFVPATTSTIHVSKPTVSVAPAVSAEDDAMALFFSEINQLEGV